MIAELATWRVAVVLGCSSRHAHLATIAGDALCGMQLKRTAAEDPTLPHATRCRDCINEATGDHLRSLDYP